ncbi:MAG TPA: MarR family transcriptional regulator [Pelagibacterium sp.]|uniref:MarR family winged helix-turn-helix transcriptional regulator n=1 Tax=Pelagibacterium sp. TaxID=1967288 RepID=UPI002B7073F3|nr:MarR family transcriptional regulator [Pelagibacterium sp.]HWJ88832.1 MarR family transcriptional regulator [Pelagibacterium sp.]
MNEQQSRPDTPDRENLLLNVGTALQAMIQGLDLAREKAAKVQKLHPTDMRCLGYLDRAGHSVSPKTIISAIGLSSGSGTALLDRLEVAGYIRRTPNPQDRRSVLIELDRKAAAEPIGQYRRIEEAYRTATRNLSDGDLRTIAHFLSDMSDISNALFEIDTA